MKKLMRRITLAIGVRLERAGRHISRKTMPRFANEPKNLTIDLSRRIQNPQRILLGD